MNATSAKGEKPSRTSAALRIAALAAIPAVLLAACRPESTGEVAGWSMVDAAERHPIIVTQQPSRLTLRVPRGSSGLTGQQQMQTMEFLARYRAVDAGNSKLVISVPSGTANEVSAIQAAAELRHLVRQSGFSDSSVAIEPYSDRAGAQPPIRVSYLRYVAEAPDCGNWPTNTARNFGNVPMENFGCASQRNLAAQIANPADLIGPRTMTPASAERRHTGWGKYVKGDSTVSQKQGDEKLKE